MALESALHVHQDLALTHAFLRRGKKGFSACVSDFRAAPKYCNFSGALQRAHFEHDTRCVENAGGREPACKLPIHRRRQVRVARDSDAAQALRQTIGNRIAHLVETGYLDVGRPGELPVLLPGHIGKQGGVAARREHKETEVVNAVPGFVTTQIAHMARHHLVSERHQHVDAGLLHGLERSLRAHTILCFAEYT